MLFHHIIKWARPDLNRGPSPCQGDVLTILGVKLTLASRRAPDMIHGESYLIVLVLRLFLIRFYK